MSNPRDCWIMKATWWRKSLCLWPHHALICDRGMLFYRSEPVPLSALSLPNGITRLAHRVARKIKRNTIFNELVGKSGCPKMLMRMSMKGQNKNYEKRISSTQTQFKNEK